VSRRLERSPVEWGSAAEQIVTYGTVPAGHKWEVLRYWCHGDLKPGDFAGLLIQPQQGSLAWFHLLQNIPNQIVVHSSDVGGFVLYAGDTLKAYYQGAPGVAGSHTFTYVDVDFT